MAEYEPIIYEMFKRAHEAMQHAYAPYSNFPVGVCIRTNDDQLFVGCNCENASYPLGWCAESSAIGAMVSAGYTVIKDIVIMAKKKAICPPCGGCRQRIKEFATADTKVYMGDKNNIHMIMTIQELLPLSFKL
jgi:cytidine deaminase